MGIPTNNVTNLQKTLPVLPTAGYVQLRIFNGEPQCDYVIRTNLPLSESKFNVCALDVFEEKYVPIENVNFTMKFSIESENKGCPKFPPGYQILQHAKAYSLFLQSQQPEVSIEWYVDAVGKPSKGQPFVRTLANIPAEHAIAWRQLKSGKIESKEPATMRELIELRATEYVVEIDDLKVHQTQLHHGGVYALLISKRNVTITRMLEVTAPNSMSMLWLVPQYVIMTLGEVMFSVTGLEFSYSQSPVNMKSVLQACWLLTVAFGNVIVVIVAELKIFHSQAYEFFLFAGIMFADMLLFMWMAYRYTPHNPHSGSFGEVSGLVASTEDDAMTRVVSKQSFRPKYVKKLQND